MENPRHFSANAALQETQKKTSEDDVALQNSPLQKSLRHQVLKTCNSSSCIEMSMTMVGRRLRVWIGNLSKGWEAWWRWSSSRDSYAKARFSSACVGCMDGEGRRIEVIDSNFIITSAIGDCRLRPFRAKSVGVGTDVVVLSINNSNPRNKKCVSEEKKRQFNSINKIKTSFNQVPRFDKNCL